MHAKALERQIATVVSAALDRYAADLASVGLTWTQPTVRGASELSSYTSEIEVDFKDETGIVDVLEFFVFRGGKEIVSADEVEVWLAEAIPDVLSRRTG